jgi:hypothetical protein
MKQLQHVHSLIPRDGRAHVLGVGGSGGIASFAALNLDHLHNGGRQGNRQRWGFER